MQRSGNGIRAVFLGLYFSGSALASIDTGAPPAAPRFPAEPGREIINEARAAVRSPEVSNSAPTKVLELRIQALEKRMQALEARLEAKDEE